VTATTEVHHAVYCPVCKTPKCLIDIKLTDMDGLSGVATIAVNNASFDAIEVGRLLDALTTLPWGNGRRYLLDREWWRSMLAEKLDAPHLDEWL
jgi:hypothetical protein